MQRTRPGLSASIGVLASTPSLIHRLVLAVEVVAAPLAAARVARAGLMVLGAVAPAGLAGKMASVLVQPALPIRLPLVGGAGGWWSRCRHRANGRRSRGYGAIVTCRCASPNTSTRSRHSRHTVPITPPHTDFATAIEARSVGRGCPMATKLMRTRRCGSQAGWDFRKVPGHASHSRRGARRRKSAAVVSSRTMRSTV